MKQLNTDKTRTDYLKLPNVAVLHHHGEKPDDHLGARSDEHLPFPSLFSIINASEGIS